MRKNTWFQIQFFLSALLFVATGCSNGGEKANMSSLKIVG